MFNEKAKEYNAKLGKEVDVFQTPKYLIARKKAIDLLEEYKGTLEEGDFWILMNSTKNGKMAYTGLIISHNGVLKINEKLPLEKRYKPSCITLDKSGYNNSLVYTYCNDEQGVFEVGECSASNCTNAYPYAMALKRLIDRVVLKTSGIAIFGIYSDSESDDFKEPEKQEELSDQQINDIRNQLYSNTPSTGKPVAYEEHVVLSQFNKKEIAWILNQNNLTDESQITNQMVQAYLEFKDKELKKRGK